MVSTSRSSGSSIKVKTKEHFLLGLYVPITEMLSSTHTHTHTNERDEIDICAFLGGKHDASMQVVGQVILALTA